VSRFYEGDEEPFPGAWFLWMANVNRTLGGQRGQQALRDLEAYLLEMPEKRLIKDRLADEQGNVCLVGALAVARRTAVGEPREKVLADLAERIPDPEMDYHGDGWLQTRDCATEVGVSRVMGLTLGQENDDWWGPGGTETPEERYERLLRWVQSHIHSEAVPA
jgi:hypothetical protein